MIVISFIKVVWVKLNNRSLVEIIESFLEYLSEYNEFKHLFIEDKSVLMLSEY